jgi:hypothetical protein
MKYTLLRHDHSKEQDTEPRWKAERKPLDKPSEFVKSFRLRIAGTPVALLIAIIVAGCQNKAELPNVRPLVLRDVPAQRLAFRFEGDTALPSDIKIQDANDQVATIRTDFIANRKADALIRTVVSPDGQRVLALYGTADEPNEAFRIDIYSSDGKFLRNLTPPDLSCAFSETVAWSPDGNYITFIAHRSAKPSPTPLEDVEPVLPTGAPTPVPSPSVAPVFAPVPLFNTEQIYICNRDGYELKPLTAREGLIYFYLSWAPDNHALVALACRESEWNAREKEFKLPIGRPRLIMPDGKERLLDDQATEALPVWSPDSSKVATAFNTDVGIYDAATNKPTQARIPLRDELMTASRAYEQKTKKPANQEGKIQSQPTPAPAEILASFNPIVRLEWPAPEKLYIQTAYVRLRPYEAYTFSRWHLVFLSPQAAILK